MEITEDHVEWAVVDRLGKMLDPTADIDCKVTRTLAMFLTLIIWVRQRVGAYADVADWPPELNVLRNSIHGVPWNLRRYRAHGQCRILGRDMRLEECSAWEFIVWLRNAIAHGDGRTIKPLNAKTLDPSRSLIGFVFTHGNAHVTLTGIDMRQVGAVLADVFRNAFSLGINFANEARNEVVEDISTEE